MSYPVYEVVWLDHWSDDDETFPHEFIDKMEITTIGYLVRETEDVMSLASGWNAQGQYFTTLHICKPLIVRKKRLRA